MHMNRGVSEMRKASKKLGLYGVTGVVALIVMFSFLSSSFAQTSTGTITGTVTDPKGLAMTGVNVVVHNVDTGADQRPVVTNDSGVYFVSSLPPGNYEVTASQTGFASVQHKGVTVQVGQTARIDIEMPVQSQQSLVTVTTEAPLIETEKTEQSQNVSESLVSNLPVGSRRWEQFVLLTPGVTPDGATGAMSFHGVNSMYNSNNVDGANNNNSYNAGARGVGGTVVGTPDGYVYSSDSIREFQVASSSYSAEIGQAAGGSVNAVTKSGTSQLHGDLFYNLRYPSLNAVDPVAKTNAAINNTVATQAVHQQHQWGGSVGGPLIKDKLFYFVTADFYRKVTPIQYTSAAGTGGTTTIAALTCPAQIGGNSDPRCTNVKDFLLNKHLGIFPRLLWQDVELVKLDYQLNQANHISGVANIRDWKEPNNTATATSTSGFFGGANSFVQDRFVIANWTMVIGSNKVNELRYQWGKDNSFATSIGPAPPVSLSQLFSYGAQSFGAVSFVLEHRNQVSDNFSFTHGSHAFKTGVDLNFIHEQPHVGTGSVGSYAYTTGVAIAGSGCPSSGGGAIFATGSSTCMA